MTVSQQINEINAGDKAYDDFIIITDIPQGRFPAVVSNNPPEGTSTREITVMLMDLEQSPGGTMHANPGLFVRQDGETAIKVTVQHDGTTLAENTTNYSS